MSKILVSSCLIGCKVRYDASCVNIQNKHFQTLMLQYEVIPFCPEVSAGLATPRPSAEIQGGEGIDVLQGNAKVIGIDSIDVSDAFCLGAQMALTQCHVDKISTVVLNEGSPSCGSSLIYSGNFDGTKKNGMGVTAALLKQSGITVLNQHNVETLLKTEKKT